MRHVVVSILASLVLVSACGGKLASQEDDGSPVHAGSSGCGPNTLCLDASAPTSDAGSITPTPPSSCGPSIAPTVGASCGQGCGFPPGHPHAIASTIAFQTLFSRRWVTCGGASISGRADEAGFEAHPQGTYDILVWDAAHHLVPDGTGGTYSILENAVPHRLQLDFQPNGGPLVGGGYIATMTDSPRMLFLDDIGVVFSHYVPVDDTGWPDDGLGVCSMGTYTPPARCAAPRGQPLTGMSDAAFSQSLSKRWFLCSAQGIGVDRPAQAGIDIRSDGTYDVLVVDPSNQVVPASDIFDRGTFLVYHQAAPDQYGVNFFNESGRNVVTTFTDTGEMIMNNNGVYEYRYVPLDVPCDPEK